MSHHRITSFFVFVFLLSGLAIGILWLRRELKERDEPVVSAPAEKEPFQTVDEALEGAPVADSAHLRELLDAGEPLASDPVSETVSPVPPEPLSGFIPPQDSDPAETVAVVNDADEELNNTKRLVDSFAPLRDPAVSMDSPENRKAIELMVKNAAMRAANPPKIVPGQ
jgi:hypothetical protein